MRLSIPLTVALLGCVPAGPMPSGLPATARAPVDSVEFVPFTRSGIMQECDEFPDGDEQPCRVRRQWTAGAVREHLGRGESVWRDGETLTFAYEGAAGSVILAGSLQAPLSPIRGTPLWVITVHIPRLDEAFVSYVFLAQGGPEPPPARVTFSSWRGPRAFTLPVRAETLRGRVVTDTLHSRFLPEPRAVTVYAPPGAAGEPPEAVVYLGDGQSVEGYARIVDSLIADGRLPRVLLVGAHSAERLPGDEPLGDQRALEYLHDYGFAYGGDDDRFLAHARFFAEELVPWAESAWGAPARREARAVLGFSNSAAMAVQMGLRRPDLFARVIAISPAGHVPAELPAGTGPPDAAFFLSGGVLEPSNRRTASGWRDLIAGAGREVVLREPVSGHDPQAWGAELCAGLAWALGHPPGCASRRQ